LKKLAALLLFIFVMCIPNLISGQSFSKYAPLLDTNMYPTIQQYINDLKIKQSLSTDTSQKIADDVFDIIAKVITEKKMIPLAPPTVYITKFKNETRAVYFLNTVIVLFDGQQSVKKVCMTSMLFEKRFLLYVEEKGKIEI